MITTFDQKLAEYLNNWYVDGWPVGNLILVLIAIFLSVILCGVIGIEREWRGRSAGLRTHLLVGVGSCIIMIISIYGFPLLDGYTRDVARLAAQVITGVGFLGAGAIFQRNSGVKGLTTAGTIWIVMAIGIACGSFNFIIAVIGTFVVALVLTIFRKLEFNINKKNLLLVLTASSDKPVLAKVLEVSKEFDCNVHPLSSELVNSDGANNVIQFFFQVNFHTGESRAAEFIAKLEKETGAISINILNDHR